MKIVSVVLILGLAGYSLQDDAADEMRCGLKTCVFELLNFNDLSFRGIIHKAHLASFCIRECSPPVVHEFFQSLTFPITKTIPGVCSGASCADKNRFVELGNCLKNRSWPLVQCGTRLVNLVELALESKPKEQYRNKTCSTLMDTTKCLETNLRTCGQKPLDIFKGLFEDFIEIGFSAYCGKSYKKERPVTIPESEITMAPETTEEIPFRKPFAKGYRRRPNGAATLQTPFYALLGSSIITLMLTVRVMQ